MIKKLIKFILSLFNKKNLTNSSMGKEISSKLKEFLKEYDSNNDLQFHDLKYRQGARITGSMGLAEGFRIVDGQILWDVFRIHLGVDRSGFFNRQGSVILNQILLPFTITGSSFRDYGPEHIYGSLIRLFVQDEFEIRIMHCYPNEVEPDFKDELIKERNSYIGKAGHYGSASTSPHTHTEIVSIGEKSELLEELLKLKFDDYNVETDLQSIINYGRLFNYFKDKPDSEILAYYEEEKYIKKVSFMNKYKLHKIDWFQGNKLATWYSSEHLFNGM